MSHYKVLMIGTIDNLDQIYADCQDSSSESKAEMTFGYDYCNPYDMIKQETPRWDNEESCMFKKDSKEFKEFVLNGIFTDVWDIRGSDCDHLIYNYDMRPRPDKEKTIEFFKSLPDNTNFFYCDAHL